MAIKKTDRNFKKVLVPFLLLPWLLIKLGDFGINLIVSIFKFVKGWKIILPKAKKKKRKSKFFRIPAKLKFGGLALFLIIFFISYSYFLIEIAHNLPSPKNLKTLPTPTTTEFYDRNGILLYRFYEGKDRTPIKLVEVPPFLIQATIAMEDKNFYKHFGVDIYGITRALVSFLTNREVQGGSTITQQLIKNTLLTPERTIKRKVKEIILAFWTERIFSKNEILEMYFNEVPYGGPVWGIAAASQTYFDKPVSDLTLAESAFLAGLPASPTIYSPYGANPDLAKYRQKQVLRRMVEEGFIDKQTEEKALNEELNIKQARSAILAPHFVMYVRSLLSEKYGERFISQGGLKIYTSLDLNLQDMAQQVVLQELEKIKNLKVSNGAAMITTPKTGEILAMVGSKNYFDPNGGNFNVTTALRQPGSSIKPITYATAFKLGFSPGNILLDSPVTFKNFWETYTPLNYDNRFHGPVTIRTALGSSYNVPAVKMLAVVTLPEMLKTARDLGITTLNDSSRYGLSLTLGGGEVKMTDMMTVYGAFSQMGKKHNLQPILKIADSKGNIIEDNSQLSEENVLNPSAAFLIADILSDNKARTPAFGSNSLLNIPGQKVAVKTGTSDNKRDNWTFGFTPEFVVGVWVGNNDNSPMNPQLTSGITGAAPIWNKIMTEVLKNRTPLAFEQPADITTGLVDGHKDLVIAGAQTKSVIGQNRKKVKEETTNEEKEVITFTDPFSTYQSDQSGQPIITP